VAPEHITFEAQNSPSGANFLHRLIPRRQSTAHAQAAWQFDSSHPMGELESRGSVSAHRGSIVPVHTGPKAPMCLRATGCEPVDEIDEKPLATQRRRYKDVTQPQVIAADRQQPVQLVNVPCMGCDPRRDDRHGVDRKGQELQPVVQASASALVAQAMPELSVD
jgi:hypothetical protein